MIDAFHRTRGRSAAPAFALLVACTLGMSAADTQTITIDWSNPIVGQQTCASTTSDTTSVTLQLNNLNDLVYRYTVYIRAIPIPQADAGQLPSTNANAALGGISPADYENAVRLAQGLFSDGGTSLTFLQTQQAITDLGNKTPPYDLNSLAARVESPPDGVTRDEELVRALEQMRARNMPGQTHAISVPYSVDKQHYYVFTVTEINLYKGHVTNKSLHWKCGFDDKLSLSVGELFTQLPFRSYNQRTVPGASGTQNVLEVDDAGPWTPVGVALLNYKLAGSDRWVTPSLAFSTGPVYKFGGTPQVSGFGWFVGLSASAWNRVFITPGLHIGEFADYPLGFGNGTPIPANFGTLTPVKRWSGRFAVSITFRTNSFLRSSGKTSDASTASSAKPGTRGGTGSRGGAGSGPNGNR